MAPLLLWSIIKRTNLYNRWLQLSPFLLVSFLQYYELAGDQGWRRVTKKKIHHAYSVSNVFSMFSSSIFQQRINLIGSEWSNFFNVNQLFGLKASGRCSVIKHWPWQHGIAKYGSPHTLHSTREHKGGFPFGGASLIRNSDNFWIKRRGVLNV